MMKAKNPCDMQEGCCFCDAPDYKRCSLCGHHVCKQHAAKRNHNCIKAREVSRG
jgi:hypothetical protein